MRLVPHNPLPPASSLPLPPLTHTQESLALAEQRIAELEQALHAAAEQEAAMRAELQAQLEELQDSYQQLQIAKAAADADAADKRQQLGERTHADLWVHAALHRHAWSQLCACTPHLCSSPLTILGLHIVQYRHTVAAGDWQRKQADAVMRIQQLEQHLAVAEEQIDALSAAGADKDAQMQDLRQQVEQLRRER